MAVANSGDTIKAIKTALGIISTAHLNAANNGSTVKKEVKNIERLFINPRLFTYDNINDMNHIIHWINRIVTDPYDLDNNDLAVFNRICDNLKINIQNIQNSLSLNNSQNMRMKRFLVRESREALYDLKMLITNKINGVIIGGKRSYKKRNTKRVRRSHRKTHRR
jgi:hypothetical protein